MDYPLEERRSRKLKELEEQEEHLERSVSELETNYSGLKDIDLTFKLINTKFLIAIELLESIEVTKNSFITDRLTEKAREKSMQAVGMLEELTGEKVSEDQRFLLTESSGYQEAKELFNTLLLRGGGIFFDNKVKNKRNAGLIADAVIGSIRKYLYPDDRYKPLFKTEDLPEFIKNFVKNLFYILAPEHQTGPPDGIEEGEETLYSSDKLKMPLSQAIYYYENEVLPELEKQLRENPGDREIQNNIEMVKQKVEEYKSMKFIPRSTPIVMPKDFYTEGLTGYTADGELLVTVPFPVIFRSGTNLQRLQELVLDDIARKLAGRGVCPELDREYYYLKGLESGRRGSSRTPGFKLNTVKGFRMLKNRYPFLKQLEDRESFKKLLTLVRKSSKKTAQKMLEKAIIQGTDYPERDKIE